VQARRPHRLEVRTSPFQGENAGSIPAGDARIFAIRVAALSNDCPICLTAERLCARIESFMHRMVPQGTWNLDELDDAERKQRLLDPPPPAELLTAVIGEAMRAANEGMILLRWCPSRNWLGCYRIVAKIPIASLLFDQLFNGRSGYRAQYYLSVEAGHDYNRAIADGLTPAIQEAYSRLSGGFEAPWHLVEQSLRGGSSKIWMPKDEEVLKAAPAALGPPRWAEYWQNHELAWGLRLPLPPSPQIDLKGSFIRPGSQEEVPTKPDRGVHLHEEGWPR
jgi:hypothetical protein